MPLNHILSPDAKVKKRFSFITNHAPYMICFHFYYSHGYFCSCCFQNAGWSNQTYNISETRRKRIPMKSKSNHYGVVVVICQRNVVILSVHTLFTFHSRTATLPLCLLFDCSASVSAQCRDNAVIVAVYVSVGLLLLLCYFVLHCCCCNQRTEFK